jgi:methionyl-tRNA formyltransferase
VPQEHALATLAPILRKEDGALDWSRPAAALHDLVRGFSPWPSAYTFLNGVRIKLHRTQVAAAAAGHAEPGVILRADREGIVVACGSGALVLLELQAEGARRMSAAEFLLGQQVHRLEPGAKLGAAAQ